MKTKELIKLLEELDPNGEFEVCIENADIERYDVLPAYYDGRIKVIRERDEHFRPTKTEVTGSGTKINLYRHDWTETFIDNILYEQKEYPVESGSGAGGQDGYNWMTAEVLAKKINLTIAAENINYVDDTEKIKVFSIELRSKYIEYIKDHLIKYVETSGHFKTDEMINTSIKLIEKCSKVGFPLEVFRFGSDCVSNKNASWLGYEFKIGVDGKFYVKDWINNKQSEKREGSTFDCTPFIECNIGEFDFDKLFNDYYKSMSSNY